MALVSFDEILRSAGELPERAVMAVAAAADPHSLEAALEARRAGIAEPLLVGDRGAILSLLEGLGESVPDEDIIDASDPVQAAARAVALVRESRASFLLKGGLDTSVLLKAVVDKERGLSRGRLMSHFTIFEIPGYHKLLAPVDGGMVTYPTLEQKKKIIENTVEMFHALGYDRPKVGVLACVEKINPKMPETVEADALKQMNLRGEIRGCIVEGPISYDCAVSKEIADYKGFESPCAGDCDILLAPNIHAGNIMGKMLTVTCGAKMAGFIVGAACPIAMTSRGSSAEEKFDSIVLAAVCAAGMKTAEA
jgi:phosphate butyryltransferase